MDGFAGGFLVKSGAGRVIINHIGDEQGFLDGGDDVFISKKDTRDYHGNMNSDRYLDWFKKVLDKVPDRTVLVLDLAPYHRKRVEETIMPTMAWRKDKMIQWMISHQIPLPSAYSSFTKMTKVKLLELSRANKIKTKYVVEQMAENCGKDVKVVWLPPAHCELNPIELIWAFVKGHVAKMNDGKNLQEIFHLSKIALNLVTPQLWQKCVQHAIKYEQIMWDRDNLVDDLPLTVNPLIIPVDDDSSSEEEASDLSEFSDNEL